MSDGTLVSVVVPVLDEARTLPPALDALAALPGRWEVLVVDGGSRDDSARLAREHPLAPGVLHVEGGRARQLNAGGAAARGELLVFLHADSRLPPGAHASLVAALADPAVVGGNFVLRFDGEDGFGRALGAWYAIQRRLGVYYGDSTLWLRRGTWAALGGFRELAVMEDYELVRRMERLGRTACLPGPAVSSGRRWRALGIWRTVASWALIRWLWILGVPAERLARLYRPVR